jgi:predicted amidohydrolase
MYVISDKGELVTRYDERLLSNTKLSFMYTPGSGPVTFEVDGLRFGCAMGIEVHFPEVFAEYERLDVDGVLFSATGPGQSADGAAAFAAEAQAHAATNSLWVSFAMSAQHSVAAPPRDRLRPGQPGRSPRRRRGSEGASREWRGTPTARTDR